MDWSGNPTWMNATPPRVVPVKPLLAILAASVGVAWLLVPSQQELFKRVMKDNNMQSVTKYLRKQLALMSRDNSGDLSDLNGAQLQQLSGLIRLTPREQLQRLFMNPQRLLKYDRYTHALALSAVRYVDVIHPREAWKVIHENKQRVTEDQQMDFALLLSENALAVGEPGLAAEILDEAAALPIAGREVILSLAQASRWSGRPLLGARRLRDWLRRHAAEVTEEAELDQLYAEVAKLALEGGNAALGLEVCLDQYQRLHDKGREYNEVQLQRALGSARQCGRSAELKLILSAYVETMPEARLGWKDLRKLAQAPTSGFKCYREYLQMLASFADWSSDFRAAFEAHYRLAACGELASLDRCLALRTFLGRDEDLAALMQELGPIAERPKLPLMLAQMLAALGEEQPARQMYESWVKAHPEDADAHYAYSCLLYDIKEDAQSKVEFQKHVERFPQEARGLKKLAEFHIREQELLAALSCYARLETKDHDEASLENYALLANSMDRPEDEVRAKLFVLLKEKKPSLELYRELADAAQYLKDVSPGIAALEEGLEAYPESPSLRRALAQLHVRQDAQQGVELAVKVLMQSCCRQSLDCMSDLLSIANRYSNGAELLGFLGTSIERDLPLSAEDRLSLGVLCYHTGNADRGKALFESTGSRREELPALADAHYQVGHMIEAAELMIRFITNNPDAVSQHWLFLGDVYDQLGYKREAQQAYDYSLQLLTKDISAPPPPRRVSSVVAEPQEASLNRFNPVKPITTN
jgi:hypothetical protein